MTKPRILRTVAAAAVLFQAWGASLPARAQTAAVSSDMQRFTQIMSGQADTNPADAGKPHVTIFETPLHDQDYKTYGFLGTNEFLNAATKANVLVIGNEIGNGFNNPIAVLQSAAYHSKPDAIKTARAALFADLNAIEKQATDVEAESTQREAPFLVDYIQKAGQDRIEVMAADIGSSDPETDKILLRRAVDQSRFRQATNPQEQARIQADADNLDNLLLARRASEDVNRPIVTALAAEYTSARAAEPGGSFVAAYALDHCDAMETEFREAGYAVSRVALHASADSVARDQAYAAQYHLAYRGLPFLMDTMKFASNVQPALAARVPPPKP